MAIFSVSDESLAPPQRTRGRLAARSAEYDGFVRRVKKGEVGKLSPSPGETTRGLVLRIARAGKRVGKAVDAWTVDGVVYFKP